MFRGTISDNYATAATGDDSGKIEAIHAARKNGVLIFNPL